MNPQQLRACGALQLDLETVNLEANVALPDEAIADFLALMAPCASKLSFLSLSCSQSGLERSSEAQERMCRGWSSHHAGPVSSSVKQTYIYIYR